ncbi:uncharacterized protein LOC134835080 [Culicoides brevitarsis]|uniref:uncharacterized protein LOC134835080 n=1 Tax=Culicoides brevitarsis TaxID=469753 RepID=UPI00307B8176
MESNSSSHLSTSLLENGNKIYDNHRYSSDKTSSSQQGLIQIVQQLSPSILQQQQQGNTSIARGTNNNNNNDTSYHQHQSQSENVCFICRQEFQSRNDFVNHLKSHIIEGRLGDASNADIIAKVILDATNGLCT